MSKKHHDRSRFTEESIPERFDCWSKKTIKNFVRNEVRKHVRERRRNGEMLYDYLDGEKEAFYDPFDETGDEKVLIGVTTVRLKNDSLIKAIRSLSERDKKILESAVLLEYPTSSIAEELGITEKSLYEMKSRLLRYLRNEMSKGGEADE